MASWAVAGWAMGRVAVVCLLAWLISWLAGERPPWFGWAGALCAVLLAGLLTAGPALTRAAAVQAAPGRRSRPAELLGAAAHAWVLFLALPLLVQPLGIGLALPVWAWLAVLPAITALLSLLRPRPAAERLGTATGRAVRDRLAQAIAHTSANGGRREADQLRQAMTSWAALAERSGVRERVTSAERARDAVLRAVPATWALRLARRPLPVLALPVLSWVGLGMLARQPISADWFLAIFLLALVLLLFVVLLNVLARPYARILRDLMATSALDWDQVPGVPLALLRQARVAEREFLDHLLLVAELEPPGYPGPRAVDQWVLPDLDPRALGESRSFVPNPASDRIEWCVARMAQASIGISGPRGVGKSTLLRRLCDRELSAHLSVFVPAPTSYDRREFLVHLFRTVCAEVMRAGGLNPEPQAGSRPLRRVAGPVLVVLGALTALAAFAWELSRPGRDWVLRNPELTALFGGLALAVAGLALAVLENEAERRRRREASALPTLARQHLRALRYQHKDIANRTTGLKLGIGLEFGAARGREHAELARGYPELVNDLREFLELLGQDGKVVIAVDELDKIDTAEAAEQFLNDLKAVFGVPGCHFLVSVSEDALAAFDLRALSTRSTFDSAFDEVLAVPRLDFRRATALLTGRGLALPQPFVWLCHSLAGGLPRDLLRTVLNLAHAKEKLATVAFEPLAWHLLHADLKSVVDGQLRRAGTSAGSGAGELTSWLVSFAEQSLTGQVPAAPMMMGPAGEALAKQSQAYLGYVSAMADQIRAARAQWPAPAEESLDLLARARAALSVDPDLAILLTKRFTGK